LYLNTGITISLMIGLCVVIIGSAAKWYRVVIRGELSKSAASQPVAGEEKLQLLGVGHVTMSDALKQRKTQFVVPPSGRKRPPQIHSVTPDACGLKAGLRTDYLRNHHEKSPLSFTLYCARPCALRFNNHVRPI